MAKALQAELILDRKLLATALNAVAHYNATNSRTRLYEHPDCIRIVSGFSPWQNKLFLLGASKEKHGGIGMAIPAPDAPHLDGEIDAIPLRRFVKALKAENIRVRITNNDAGRPRRIEIVAGEGKATVSTGFSVNPWGTVSFAFPTTIARTRLFETTLGLLQEAVDRVGKAAKKDDPSRPGLSALQMLPSRDERGVRLMAADGFWLAHVVVPAKLRDLLSTEEPLLPHAQGLQEALKRMVSLYKALGLKAGDLQDLPIKAYLTHGVHPDKELVKAISNTNNWLMLKGPEIKGVTVYAFAHIVHAQAPDMAGFMERQAAESKEASTLTVQLQGLERGLTPLRAIAEPRSRWRSTCTTVWKVGGEHLTVELLDHAPTAQTPTATIPTKLNAHSELPPFGLDINLALKAVEALQGVEDVEIQVVDPTAPVWWSGTTKTGLPITVLVMPVDLN